MSQMEELEERFAVMGEMTEAATLRAENAALRAKVVAVETERDDALTSASENLDHARQIEDRAREMIDERDLFGAGSFLSRSASAESWSASNTRWREKRLEVFPWLSMYIL